MFTWEDGQEFHIGEPVGWAALALRPGMIIEVKLEEDVALGNEDLWAGFLVVESSIEFTGLSVLAKSLVCTDGNIAKALSSWFNRRAGYLHVCAAEGCQEDDYQMHVRRLRVFSVDAFKRPYMTPASVKQLRKWLEEINLAVDNEGPGEEAAEEEPPGEAGKPAGPRPRRGALRVPQPGKQKEGEEGTAGGDALRAADRARLRERLEKARDRMVGAAGLKGAGGTAGHPIDLDRVVDVSSSPGYSPSEATEVKTEKPRRRKAEEGERATQAHHGALAIMGAGIRPAALVAAPTSKSKSKKVKKRRRAEKKGAEEVTTASTTGNLQKQLLARAAETAQERRDRRQDRKGSKDPGRQLATILTKVMGKKKKKESRKKRRRKRKRREGGDPGGGSSGSSGDSATSSSGKDYGDGSEEEDSSSSDSGKMEPPLKKKAMKRPGSVMRMLVEHAKEKLDQSSKVTIAHRDGDDPTQGVRLTSYYSIVVKSQLAAGCPQLRELHFLAHSLDLLRAGELDSLGDLLASRFVSLHQAGLDGHWGAARHLEVLPFEDNSAAGPAIVLRARKHARLAAQVAGTEPGSWRGGGKGRGKGQQQWEDNWNQNNRTKGKKGDKGKGKGKQTWKGQSNQEAGGDHKQREKVPDK